MEFKSPQVLMYITEKKDRVLGNDPITLLICDDNDKKVFTSDMARTLKGNVVQLENGDFMILSNLDHP